MGARGRVAKSEAHHKLRGSKAKTKVYSEPGGELIKPAWLGKIAAATWDEKLPQLLELNRISPLDDNLFAVYCDTYETFCKSRLICDQEGLFQETATGYKVAHPAATIMRNARQDMLAYSARLGLSLPDRQRTPAPPKPKKELDPITSLMNE